MPYKSQVKEFMLADIASKGYSGGVTTEVGSKTNMTSNKIQNFPEPLQNTALKLN
jgi:hypothetical protein